MFDARLEVNIYHLLQRLGRSPGPWIGAPIKLSSQPGENVPATTFDGLVLDLDGVFVQYESEAEADFLSIREGIFVERTNSREELSTVPFEYVVPKELSFSSTAGLPVVKTENAVWVGLELRDLPAKYVHEPWTSPDGIPAGYPEPIVDHAHEREVALERYAAAKD